MQRSTQLGSYELKAKLAVGGFCEIWLTHQRGPMGFKRWCALKLLKQDHLRDESSRRSLMAEARLVGRLDHPNLIYLFEFGHDEDTGQLYYAMPYVSGRSLSTLVERGLDTPYFGTAEALWIGARLLSALAHVHQMCDESGQSLGIIHRDISPENILISFGGKLRLIDFGIALSHMLSRQTHHRRVKGKAQYLSPEQARGEHALDARSDIYSAGLIMFLLLTGREAYDADFMTALKQARQPNLPPVAEVTDVPRELAHRVDAMLTPEPDQRASSARELSQHLRALLHRLYPGYDEWAFAKNVGAVLSQEHTKERDFLASLGSGTQVIRDERLEMTEDERAEYTIHPETTELDVPESLRETTRPVGPDPEATAPDLSAPRQPGRKRRSTQPIEDSGGKRSRSMEEIFEELENLYKK